MVLLCLKYYSGDYSQEDEMDIERVCRKKRNAYRVFLRKPERDHLEDQGIDGN